MVGALRKALTALQHPSNSISPTGDPKEEANFYSPEKPHAVVAMEKSVLRDVDVIRDELLGAARPVCVGFHGSGVWRSVTVPIADQRREPCWQFPGGSGLSPYCSYQCGGFVSFCG